jgi:hypothetical protein
VAHAVLQRVQRGSAVQGDRSEGVPQTVRTDLSLYTGLASQPLHSTERRECWTNSINELVTSQVGARTKPLNLTPEGQLPRLGHLKTGVLALSAVHNPYRR